MHEALFYRQEHDSKVVCGLCCHRCHIDLGKRGICGVRENIGGLLFTLVYGKLAAQHIDPVEKKPMFHFLPGSTSYSIATVGCNFQCLHCQNYSISQYPHQQPGLIAAEDSTTSPQEVVDAAVGNGCASISYTYVEPTIFYEFAYDCAVLARACGIKNIFVSNGFMTAEVARQLATVLDGINIDLKAFSDDFYRKVCKARLQPVMDNIRLLHELGVWMEVTTLVIPGLNDSEDELRAIASFLTTVSPDIPWHVSGFHPTYKMLDRPRTPASTLLKAREIGRAEGLRYVYTGNIPGSAGEDTCCPSCGTLLIQRRAFASEQTTALVQGHCRSCGLSLPGVWPPPQE